ncbi:MAG: FtsQ-type POTRA domain-containing protein [Clostridia bacterium]|nr:FtsQ-type POTRA domain-containing protein [Clostridia bacterium]
MHRKTTPRTLAALILLIAILAIAIPVILNQWVFVVRNVVVNGSGNVPAEEVIRLSKIDMGGKLRKIDVEQIARHVESDGRFAFESLEVHYPNTVVLNVRMRTHDALTLQGSKIVVMDSDGYVISVHDQVPLENVPYVTNLKISAYTIGRQIDAAADRIAGMKAIVEAIKSVNVARYVSEVNVLDPNHLEIISRTGIYVKLGDASNMENKITWMAAALADLESKGQTSGTLDVASGTKADFSAG